MNDRIRLGFKNKNTLVKERVLSKHEFPIEISEGQNTRVNVLFTAGSNKKIFESYLTALSDFIMTKYESKLLKWMIKNQYRDIKPFQLNEILSLLESVEDDARLSSKSRRNSIKEGLFAYFSENSSANVEGLVAFRLKDYIALLYEVTETLIDKYLTEKEYEEFIELLRYFIHVQGMRPSLTHLVVKKGGMYLLLDENENDITKECIREFARPDELCAESFDDLLISILITLAPERIVVHNSGDIENREIFHTIEKVFDSVTFCDGCNLCTQTKQSYK